MKQKTAFLPIAFVVLLVAAGCADQKKIKFLGQWTGSFNVDKVHKGPDAPEDRKHHALRGYVAIVLNKMGYTMHLEGEQQQVDVKGTWSYQGNQVVLAPVDVKINNDNGPGEYNPNLKYVPDEDLYNSYGKKLILSLSNDGTALKSPSMSIAFLEGEHLFKKD